MHWLMKAANNDKFESSQLKTFLLHHYFYEEIETVYLQSHFPGFGNNLFENNTIKVLALTKLDENLGFSIL